MLIPVLCLKNGKENIDFVKKCRRRNLCTSKKYLDRHMYIQKFTRAAIYIKNLKWDAIYSDFGDHFLDTSVCAKVQYIILYSRTMKFYKFTIHMVI